MIDTLGGGQYPKKNKLGGVQTSLGKVFWFWSPYN